MDSVVVEEKFAIENGQKVLYEVVKDRKGNLHRIKTIYGDQDLMDIAEKIIRRYYTNDLAL